jgi:hypothetical protein
MRFTTEETEGTEFGKTEEGNADSVTIQRVLSPQ